MGLIATGFLIDAHVLPFKRGEKDVFEYILRDETGKEIAVQSVSSLGVEGEEVSVPVVHTAYLNKHGKVAQSLEVQDSQRERKAVPGFSKPDSLSSQTKPVSLATHALANPPAPSSEQSRMAGTMTPAGSNGKG